MFVALKRSLTPKKTVRLLSTMATPAAQCIASAPAPPAWISFLPLCALKEELGKVLIASHSLPMIEESWEDLFTLFLPAVPRQLQDIIVNALLNFDQVALRALKTADNQSDEAGQEDDDDIDDNDADEGQEEADHDVDADYIDDQECVLQACTFLELVKIGQTF